MNDKIFDFLNRKDKEFINWFLVKKQHNIDKFISYPYEAQLGIVDEYLFTQQRVSVKIQDNKPCIIYYINDGIILKEIMLEPIDNPSYLSIKLAGLKYLVNNKYLPF